MEKRANNTQKIKWVINNSENACPTCNATLYFYDMVYDGGIVKRVSACKKCGYKSYVKSAKISQHRDNSYQSR